MKRYYTVYVEGKRARSFTDFQNARKYAETALCLASTGIGHYPKVNLRGPHTPNQTSLYYTVSGWRDKPMGELIVCEARNE